MQLKQDLTLEQKLDQVLDILTKQCLEIDWVLRSIRLVMRNQQWPRELESDVNHVVASIDELLARRDRDRTERLAMVSERPTPVPPRPSGGVT